jgi:hypothetical protein
MWAGRARRWGAHPAPAVHAGAAGKVRPVGNERVDPGVGFCYTGSVAKRGVAGEAPDLAVR